MQKFSAFDTIFNKRWTHKSRETPFAPCHRSHRNRWNSGSLKKGRVQFVPIGRDMSWRQGAVARNTFHTRIDRRRARRNFTYSSMDM